MTIEDRHRAVRRVLWITLVLNVVVAASKYIIGHYFHLLSLAADGLHSSFDGINNLVGLVAMRMAAKPPDNAHPYGYRKFETFAALAIGVSLGALGAGLAWEAVTRLSSQVKPETHVATFAVAIVTLFINFGVASYEGRRGRELGSELLVADAQHTRGDVLVTLAVLLAQVAVAMHAPLLDLAAALAIALFIGWTAYQVISRSVRVLADAASVDREAVAELARAVEGVRAVHNIRSRGPEGHIFVDLHIHVEASLPTGEAHQLAHRVAGKVKEALPGIVEVLVHIEPEGDPED